MELFIKTINTTFSFLLLLVLVSCSDHTIKNNEIPAREYQVGAYLWFQSSGEFRALCYQAYNLAKFKLDQDLKKKTKKHDLPRALVFDIDETVFDNSLGGASDVKNDVPWSVANDVKWIKQKIAEAIPGAKDFVNYASSKNVELIFISNRNPEQIEDTFQNFKKLGMTVKKENFYFLTDSWSKEKRRQDILKKYNVVLYFGDSLGDFDKDWDGKSSEGRRASVDLHARDFGEKFIILPNPLYGDWEKSLPKTKKRTDLLKTAI